MSNTKKAKQRRKNYIKARNVKNNNLPKSFKGIRLKQELVNDLINQAK